MTNPPPRPALRKAVDAAVHPAAPRCGALALDAPGARTASKGEGPTVELRVTLPKALRKAARAKAAEHGYSVEEATVELLRIWVDG